MKDVSAPVEFELLPFLRSPGGCLVTVFCLLVGGCFCGLQWLKGHNSFTFECGKGRTIVVHQARDKEFDKDTTYDFEIWVYDNDHLKRRVRKWGTVDMANEMQAKTDTESNVVGVLWPGSEYEYLFIHDFRDNRTRSNLAEACDDAEINELARLLNNNPDNPMLHAR